MGAIDSIAKASKFVALNQRYYLVLAPLGFIRSELCYE